MKKQIQLFAPLIIILCMITHMARAGELALVNWPESGGNYTPQDVATIAIKADGPTPDVYFSKIIPVECNFPVTFSVSGTAVSAAGGVVSVAIQNPTHPIGNHNLVVYGSVKNINWANIVGGFLDVYIAEITIRAVPNNPGPGHQVDLGSLENEPLYLSMDGTSPIPYRNYVGAKSFDVYTNVNVSLSATVLSTGDVSGTFSCTLTPSLIPGGPPTSVEHCVYFTNVAIENPERGTYHVATTTISVRPEGTTDPPSGIKKFDVLLPVPWYVHVIDQSSIKAIPASPEINVQRPSGTSIPDDGSDPVGNRRAGTVSLDYTIDNTSGTDQLSVGSISGASYINVSGLTTTTPMPLTVSSGSTGMLNVSFNVGTGPFSFQLDINNNDSNENPYDIYINGVGILPEMNVKRGVTDIADGGSFDFGSVSRNNQSDAVFTIENAGTQQLTLTTPLTLGGANADRFSITAQPSSPVAIITGSTYFTVRFSPTTLGLHTATLAIDNNDADENPYNLTFTGTGVNAAPIISTIPDQTINEDDSTGWLPFTLTDGDGDPASLLVSAGSDNQDLLPNAKINFKGTGANRFIRVIPSPDSSGTGTVHVTVRDGLDLSSISFHVTVLPVNDPPQFVSPLPPVSLVQGTTYTVPIALLEPLVTDPDDPFESLIWSIPASAHLSPLVTPTVISVTAPTDWVGTETLTVSISDGMLSDSTPLTVIVTATADVTPPAAPANLTATPGPTYIDLAWDANTEPDVAAYVILRDPGGNILSEARIDTVIHPTHTYRDQNVPVGTTLTYRVCALDASGNESDPSDPADAIIETGITDQTVLPTAFGLEQNYPNPFNPETRIRFNVVEPCRVVLKVYNLLGHEVATLVNEAYQPGIYHATFNATGLPSGIYLYKIQMGKFKDMKKMTLLE